jgi:hypothetical protein
VLADADFFKHCCSGLSKKAVAVVVADMLRSVVTDEPLLLYSSIFNAAPKSERVNVGLICVASDRLPPLPFASVLEFCASLRPERFVEVVVGVRVIGDSKLPLLFFVEPLLIGNHSITAIGGIECVAFRVVRFPFSIRFYCKS